MGENIKNVEVFYDGEIITRKEAKSLNLKCYFTGNTCKYGHIAQRQTCSGQCIECKRERTRRWRRKPEKEKYTNIKVAKELPHQEILLERWSYNKDSGELIWKERPLESFPSTRAYNTWKTKFEGKAAGSRHYANGYIEVRTEDKALHKAHRIIWKMVTGEEPDLPIDHKNGIPWDNSWDNLRLATNQDNARNSSGFSGSKFKGVIKDNNKWIVQWCINDTNFSERGFNNELEAARYYDKIAKEHYGEFAKLNFPEEENNEV